MADNLEYVVAGEIKNIFIATVQHVNYYLSRNEEVPAGLVKYLMSAIHTKKEIGLYTSAMKAEMAAPIVLDKLTKYPEFQFKWKFMGLNNLPAAEEYTLAQFAEIMLNGFFQSYSENLETTKDEAIRFFYRALCEEVIPALDSSNATLFNDKTKRAIAGVFAIAAGFKITNRSTDNLTTISDSARNAIKKGL